MAGQRLSGAANRRTGPRLRLHLRLFCHFERIINFDTQVPHGAFQLAMPEQELDRAKILCPSINEGGLGAPQRVRSVGRRIQTDLPHPATDDASILTRGEVRRAAKPAWEHEIVSSQTSLPKPRAQNLPRLFRNLELHRALSFLLHNDRPCSDPVSVDKIADPQLHEIARSQFTIDGQVKERQFSNSAAQLQPDPNRPDVLQAQRRFLSDEFSFVPRPDSRTSLNEVVHGNTPRWKDGRSLLPEA